MPTNVAVWTDNQNYVMSKGKIIAEGSADELLADERIRKVYLVSIRKFKFPDGNTWISA